MCYSSPTITLISRVYFGASVKQNLEVVNIQNILYKNAYRALTSFCQDFLLFIIAVNKLVSGKHD